MVAEENYRSPTAYDELLFIDCIYKTQKELHAKLGDHGFKMTTEIPVPKVECFMYIPAAFPKNQAEVTTLRRIALDPVFCSQAADFDFEAIQGQRIPIGVCIGGTCLHNGWDEKCKLGVQGILKINHNCSSADKAATQIFLAVDDFFKDIEALSEFDIHLDVHICGYSLGGLFAQVTTVLLQDWANTTGNRVTCRTFESPGVPEMYHDIASNYDEDAANFWKERVANYKSLPNPLNTVFLDVGRVFHLKNPNHINWNRNWVFKCIAGTTRRVVFWGGLLKGFGVSGLDKAFENLSKLDQRRIIGAAIALDMGMDLCEVVRNHDVALMIDCFDKKAESLLPGACIEMEQWPIYDHFSDFAMKLFENMSHQLTPFSPFNAGLHTLFLFGGKRGFVERKLLNLPGYIPLTEKNIQEDAPAPPAEI